MYHMWPFQPSPYESVIVSVQVAPFCGIVLYTWLATPLLIDVPSVQDRAHAISLA